MKNNTITTLPSADVLGRLVTTCGTKAGRRLGDFLNRAIDSFVDSVFDGNGQCPTGYQNNRHQNQSKQR